jgi:transposase InsO family protein
LKRIRQKYEFDNMKKKIAKYIKDCKCKINKHSFRTKMPMKITTTPQKGFDVVSIDSIGPFVVTKSNNKYAVTIQDDLTKYIEIIPVPSKEANMIAKAIAESFITTYGVMRFVKTDMGTEYLNEIFKEICQIFKIQHVHSTAYHPQAIGGLERSHRCLNEYLRSFINDNKWDVAANFFKFCYNTTPAEHGYTPFQLTYGRLANLPIEITRGPIEPIYNIDNYAKELKFRFQSAFERTNKLLIDYKERRKLAYDKNVRNLSLSVKDKVLLALENMVKLDKVYAGPFEVIK